MLQLINSSFRILAKGPPATSVEIETFLQKFGSVQEDYLALVSEATDLELEHINGQYLRIWGPSGSIDFDEGYSIRKWIPGAIPIGDDGGGRLLFYHDGLHGFGIYHVGFGALAAEEARWAESSLTALLVQTVDPNFRIEYTVDP